MIMITIMIIAARKVIAAMEKSIHTESITDMPQDKTLAKRSGSRNPNVFISNNISNGLCFWLITVALYEK